MDEGSVRDIILKCEITRDQAINAVRRWWLSPLVAWGLKWHGQIIDCRCMYIPFWAVKAKVSGTLTGERDVETESYSIRTHEKQTIDGNLIWNEIACDMRDIGIRYLWNLAGNPIVSDDRLKIVRATVSKKQGLENGIFAIKERALQMLVRMDMVYSNEIRAELLKMDMIVYPLWLLRYRYEDRLYSATVDGVTGEILAGRAPGNGLLKRFSKIFGYTLFMLGVVQILLGLLLHNSDLCVVLWILAIIYFIIGQEALSYSDRGDVIVKGQIEDGYKPFRYYKTHSQVVKNRDVDIQRSAKIIHK